MKLYGLIGYPISHSFSKKFFTQKFETERITDSRYELFPIEQIEHFPKLLENNPNLAGLNVTIPYKELVLPFLDEVEESAKEIGAVNTIRIKNGKLTGFNTDVFGFERSLKRFLNKNKSIPVKRALIFGTGGASKAVAFVLKKMNISFLLVSRDIKKGDLRYIDLDKSVMQRAQLLINTSPLGMAPNIESFPDIPYEWINKGHLLFDLVYNPEKTVFLIKGESMHASVRNGLEMLIGQAERAWEIWSM